MGEARDSPLLQSILTGSRVHTTPYSVDNMGYFPEAKGASSKS